MNQDLVLSSLAILLKFAVLLAIAYVILFIISNTLIKVKKAKTYFLNIGIVISMMAATYMGLSDIQLMDPSVSFWSLFIYGNVLALLAEVFLYAYKRLVFFTGLNKDLYLGWWYIDQGFLRVMAVTVLYGIAISTPIAYYLIWGNTVISIALFLFFVALFFIKKRYPIIDKYLYFWSKE